MTRKLVTILAGLALLVALAPAIGLADSISGSAGAGWQTWGPTVPTPSLNPNPYWDGISTDGSGMGVGYCITGTGSCDMSPNPGTALPYWGIGTAADSDITFTAAGTGNGAALEIEIAGNAKYNSFGYCESSNDVCTQIFGGSQGAGATATFTPTGSYYFYIDDSAVGDTWDSNASKNTQGVGDQHFAVFNGGSGTYWLGMEDLPFSCGTTTGCTASDKDYNDMVVKVTSSAVPEPGTLTLLGTGLIGLAGFIRRRRAA